MASDSSSASSEGEREPARKQHKKHHHHHRDEKKHDRKKHEKRHRKHEKEHKKKRRHHADDKEAAVRAPGAVAAPAWAPFAAVVAANPASRAELRSLLEMLDEGQVVVLDHIEDTAMRSRLQSALEALGLPSESLPDGSRAHAKPEGSTQSLAAHFASILDDSTMAAADGRADGPPEPSVEGGAGPQEPTVREPAAARRVYGVAARPPPSDSDIGPAMPPPALADDDVDGDEDEPGIGPALPSSNGGAESLEAGAAGGNLWWQNEQMAPKPAAPPAPADGTDGPSEASNRERDGWMVSLPSASSDPFGTGQARQFTKNGIKPVGDQTMWTDTPADLERKAKAAEARSWGAAAGSLPGGSGGGGSAAEPMTLAEAVALAKRNAAAGKRPRGFETKRVEGGGGGGGGGDSSGPQAKSLVDLHAEQKASEKKEKKGKADWEGQHPWKPWNRDTDLDVRTANPKGKETILNNQHMGTLGDRFGGGSRETTFM